MSVEIIHGIKVQWIQFRMWLRIGRIAFEQFKNPILILSSLRKVLWMRKNLLSKQPLKKMVKIEKRYFWDMNQPGWPSSAFDQNFRWMLNKLLKQNEQDVESVRMVFMAITKKCPMNCEHCYEWNEINKIEVLELGILKQIVAKYQALGASYFILGGGEPMARYHDMVELLKSAASSSDFWMSTSGYNLNLKRAIQLKEAGLTGVTISIDHFDQKTNNKFRGSSQAMLHALEAAKNALNAGLGLSISLCATRKFITEANLFKYAKFAKDLGTGFIWLMEPRAAGRYEGKDVQLSKEHFEILDHFYQSINNNKEFLAYPRIVFPNYNHRRMGCAGAGSRNIMIDTDGYVNPCPFCRKQIVHALAENSREKVKEMRLEGCFKFETRNS